MEDNRFTRTDGEAITRFRKRLAWTQEILAAKAGVSLDTIKRAERGEAKQLGIISKIAKALNVEPTAISQDFHQEPAAVKDYSWDDLVAGAKNVGEKIHKDETLLMDAVLTFPGPSSLFCGLVLATLPLKTFIRIPVYTGVFVDAHTPTSARLRHFHVITMPLFKILVPLELTENRTKKIIVIDDTIITGGTMEYLRKFFDENYDPRNVKFACCICHESRTFPTEKPPEIIGLRPLEQRRTFPMPWGSNSFCFEDAFPLNER